jgi:hypothetical protein
MFERRDLSGRFVACLFIAVGFMSEHAFAQFDGVLDRVRQGAEQVSGNNPTYYLKSARAVEPNICLYSNGDPSGVVGPLVFRSNYVATPNCKEFKACSETAAPVDEPKPLDCGAEIPNSRYWSRAERAVTMRSDETTSLELISEEYVRVRSCTEVRMAAATCTTGNIGLFRAEVEYDYPSGQSRDNWDRFQNLAGRRTEQLTRLVWRRDEQSVKTGERKSTEIRIVGRPSDTVPAHGVSAVVSHKYGDREATIRFRESDDNLTHYARLAQGANGAQDWEISAQINRRPSPSVTKVGFIPSTFMVSVEDADLPDLLAMPAADGMKTKYLITMYTEKDHKDETLIFQTEAENTAKSVLFTVRVDQATLQSMKGKDRKVRVHVRAQRSGNPWIDGAVSDARIYETEKSVKFPKK